MTRKTDPAGQIVLDHGTGAQLSHELLDLIVERLGDVYVGVLEDSAVLSVDDPRIAMTTDSFVVDPPFFGNGDVGKIAVCGTVNDLAVAGATPRFLTLGMILETGLPVRRLIQVLDSVRATAAEAGVQIVAGDTKVVRAGEADQLYLNTAGVGVFHREPLRMASVRPGDVVVLSGQIGSHTVHLLSIREGLGFEARVLSDCAPLNNMIEGVLAKTAPGAVRSMRDVTRGGLAAVLHEYAASTGRVITVDESALPIQHETAMAADMLGINPIHAANEGCAALFVDPAAVPDVLSALASSPYGTHAAVVGTVTDRDGPAVTMRDRDGRESVIDQLRGAELPRLC
ncbi:MULTISPECIES: hydrogenase expression/formation protein HypE [unclassified Solwaraspora]|uniref:hydrogenase expression/formation protein HypE n=1 Tax=unclassified Solwaraspora TaxID=2627926 RepID=UPI00248B3F9F|nr:MULTISPECIES: hydrogenase expression/formation protein HypE [unclassified Solwaraspora]WBB96667.1 hydrogenase expression/formation protein HypE [Solwaraspora sp. WMMA2059]WBC19429.1 hydrogenase expression/formation protein HypE [Solwaraspora sp. WMMA2080]WJK32988.1 hydrogenase expression/formation protein HypE [Solwaraspora sp. WMMA2065]